MFSSLDRFGLPVKYAIVGVLGGVIWSVIAAVFDWQSSVGGVATIAALGVGGYVGGIIRKNQGKKS